jgi:oligosaccharide repeat unit polymerase
MLVGFIGCLFLLTSYSAISNDGWLSPPKFFALVFMFEFGLQEVTAIHMVASDLAALIIIILILFYMAGYFLFNKINYFSNFSKSTLYLIKNNVKKKRFEITILIMILMALVGSIIYSAAFDIQDLSSLLSDGGARRELMMNDQISISYLSKVGFILCYAVVIISTVYYIFYGSIKYVIPSLIPVLILGLAQSGRAGIIFSCFIVFIGVYFRDLTIGKVNKYNLIKKSMYTGFFMIIIFISGHYARYGSDIEYSSFLDSLRSLSDYFFGGLSGFANYINLDMYNNDLTYGSYTFSGLFQMFGLTIQEKGLYDQYVPIDQLGGVTNLYSGFRPFIDDFGFLGTAACFFFAGCVSSVVSSGLMSGKIQYFAPLLWIYLWIGLLPICTITYFNSFLAALIIPFFIIKICLKK